MNFNGKFRDAYFKLIKNNYKFLNENDINLNIFTSFGSKLNYEEEDEDVLSNLETNSINLDEFRQILILNFIAKFTNRK